MNDNDNLHTYSREEIMELLGLTEADMLEGHQELITAGLIVNKVEVG